ncbi:MAG TPA: MAPEG family protein [Rhizomicrobium sp.]|nr:MAPEG family protein [Rhizomicrobium sp.]
MDYLTVDGPLALHFAGLSVEMTMLGIAMVLGLLQLFIAARLNNGQRGPTWNLGARDGEPPPVSKGAGRMERARVNFMETFPFFAVTVLALEVLSRHNAWTVFGSEVYVAARILYVPLYGLGVFGIRTLVWVIGTGAIIAMLVALFLIR